MPALLALLDADGRYAWVNEGYSQWFGRPAGEIVGRHPAELLGAHAWDVLRPYVERALAGEAVTYDHRAERQGRLRDLRVAYTPHRDASGSVRGIVVLVSDVTDMKAVETALRRSEQMLEQSQSAVQVGSWELMLDGATGWVVPGTSVWSRETYRILGYDPGTPASLALFYQRVHPDDRRSLQTRMARSVESGAPVEDEYRIVLPDGRVRVIHAWLDFDREVGNDATRVFGTCQDVTERMAAETEVRRAREQLQLVVDATPAYIARYDLERRLVWANKSYAARFNALPEELVGRRLVDLIGEPAFAVQDPYFARVAAGESLRVEMEVPFAGGSRFMHMIASPTVDADGVVDGGVAVLTDLTHRRQLEQERERALSELREAARHKDEFLAMLSHELRNPLASILNAVEVLEHLGPRGEDPAGEFHSIVARQARHMKRLIDDLLDASRVSLGKIQLQKERVDLRRLIEQAVEVSRPMIVEKRHALSLALAPVPMTVNADSERIIQVLVNLINNAAKYTGDGGHVTIISAVEGDEAVVTVRDDGIGMTPDLLARAFDLFAQETRAPDRLRDGLGIGLTLVRTLVSMHDGSVRAFSEGPGHGCDLVVRLPLAQPAEPVIAHEAPAAMSGSDVPLRVLVVDDSADVARALGRLVQVLGHEVAVAHDGVAALAAAAAAPPDLVLLDIGLPGMDGYSLASRLRDLGHARASIVAVTGYGGADDIRRARDAGFDDHLVKPVDLAQLQKIGVEARGRLTPAEGTVETARRQ